MVDDPGALPAVVPFVDEPVGVPLAAMPPAAELPGDPGAGNFKDATVLKNFGDVPDDLSAL